METHISLKASVFCQKSPGGERERGRDTFVRYNISCAATTTKVFNGLKEGKEQTWLQAYRKHFS
jgi:hypothetical protein